MSPTIYGIGNGFFNTLSIQIPAMIRTAIKVGRAAVIGSGSALWNHVHILDLTELYELMLWKLISGEELAYGEDGIYFAETGEHTWLELSETLAKAGHQLGVLDSATPDRITLDIAVQRWAGGNLQLAELGFASQSRTVAVRGRELGWQPRQTRQDFEDNLLEEFKVILGEDRR